MSSLSSKELERYDRQIKIFAIGVNGQTALKKSKVAVLGVGGVGCSAVLYLAFAGIGNIKIVDKDKVSPTNLNRQILYTEEIIDQEKATSAKKILERCNPNIRILAENTTITEGNVEGLIGGYDFVVDCTDTISDRLLVNAACVKLHIPAVHSFVYDFRGEIITVVPDGGACLRCIVDQTKTLSNAINPPPTEVIGVSAGVLGIMSATEAIKYILSLEKIFSGERTIVDLLEEDITHLRYTKNKNCPCCGAN